ncbi:MAG: type II toxin-antitoxin system prevent-host-death family antitoxin [Trueperaceae bacterium]|nr:type II toxin-antitoxin system prevent-host-death family antitoxin [Trueperaceae bacterium]
MTKVNMHEAKTNLSKLVELALQGEDIILAKSGKALVRLVPVETEERPVGLHASPLSDTEAQAALDPLSDEELGFNDSSF